MSKLARLAFAALLAFLVALPALAEANGLKNVGRDAQTGRFTKLSAGQKRLRSAMESGSLARDARGRFVSTKAQAQEPLLLTQVHAAPSAQIAAAPAKKGMLFALGRFIRNNFKVRQSVRDGEAAPRGLFERFAARRAAKRAERAQMAAEF